MSRNWRLDYLTAVIDEIDYCVSDLDVAISDADDGEPSSVKQAKQYAVEHIDDIIHTMQELRKNIISQTAKHFLELNT